MSEYQYYEFMTVDRPLTKEQIADVESFSSHIEVTSKRAFVEYNYGDFKHDPIEVLQRYFDGFLYWANWGSPRLAFRFPHGSLPANLLDGYDLAEFVTFTRHRQYDILDIEFGEMEGPDEWASYELKSLIGIRDELLEGDLRALYIVWLAGRDMLRDEEEEEEVEEDESDEEDDDNEVAVAPEIPPAFGSLTVAQQALAVLLQVPEEMLGAAAQHSSAAKPSIDDNFAAWVNLLPQKSRDNYLVRLAHNEPGLSRVLVKELRVLGRGESVIKSWSGERVSYAVLLAESEAVKVRQERERYEQEQLARLRRLQEIHDHLDDYWLQVDQAAMRGTGAGYTEAERLLIGLREVANQFNEFEEFQLRFRNWAQLQLRRPALIKRLREGNFPLPGI